MHPLVVLAKTAIAEFVKHKKKLPQPEGLPEDMKRQAGVFVSLKKAGQLRGCIGTFLPATENIHEEIVRNAVAAATEDPRFGPVGAEELDAITYSVDVLSFPEKVGGPGDLDPKKYGIIVSKGCQRGLLLPDLEGVDTVEDQLRITKMKAGINPYDNDIEIHRFTVTRYK
ncbi:MAG: AmmeMemoRadiSam system protein A [Nitrospirae bacterium]|nr:MAG: AmmeMemoRadiSam system protein A [Nitrospirota bacterium]